MTDRLTCTPKPDCLPIVRDRRPQTFACRSPSPQLWLLLQQVSLILRCHKLRRADGLDIMVRMPERANIRTQAALTRRGW